MKTDTKFITLIDTEGLSHIIASDLVEHVYETREHPEIEECLIVVLRNGRYLNGHYFLNNLKDVTRILTQ